MKELNRQLLLNLATQNQYPSLSLYMPTHRKYPENGQDVIRFKQLVKQLGELLPADDQKDQSEQLLSSFEQLTDDQLFWNHTLDGLAVFASKGVFEVFNMAENVNELAVVKTGFHLSPLRQYLQRSKRYFVLGLRLDEIQLFEGNRQLIWQVDLPKHVAGTIEQALGDELTEKHGTVASYGGSAGQRSPMHHGQGGKSDEADKDAERFFRVVSKEIDAFLSETPSIPIILAALPEHHNLFRRINNNPALLASGIDYNPKSISHEKLAEYAWAILEKDLERIYQGLIEKYGQAKADHLGGEDLEEVLIAALAGRVDTLILQEVKALSMDMEVSQGGKLYENTRADHDEKLDNISEVVIKMGGEVVTVPSANMPGKTGCAAIFRY